MFHMQLLIDHSVPQEKDDHAITRSLILQVFMY